MTADWMGVGVSKDSADSARNNASDNEKDAKLMYMPRMAERKPRHIGDGGRAEMVTGATINSEK
jgi:hypothetical protein